MCLRRRRSASSTYGRRSVGVRERHFLPAGGRRNITKSKGEEGARKFVYVLMNLDKYIHKYIDRDRVFTGGSKVSPESKIYSSANSNTNNGQIKMPNANTSTNKQA